MNNAFDSANFSDGVPDELVQGSMFAWTNTEVTEAYPTDEYTLTFFFTKLAAPYTERKIAAGKTSSAHVVETAETDGFLPGEYQWRAQLQRDSDNAVVDVDRGLVTILPSSGDASTHTYKVLTAIRATIEGTASREQSRIEIAGRILEYRTLAELLQLEREYSKRWNRERASLRRKSGRRAPRTLIGLGA